MVKNLLAMWETQVLSLGQEDPLEKGMATHSSIHAWEIPWTKEPGGLQTMGSQSRARLSDFTSLHPWETRNVIIPILYTLKKLKHREVQ